MTDTPSSMGTPNPAPTAQPHPDPPAPDTDSPLPISGDPESSGVDRNPLDTDLTKEEQEALASMSMLDLSETDRDTTQEALDPEAVIRARIVQVHGDDVFVDLGGKAEGVVPRSQFGQDDEPTIGRTIEVVFDRFDPISNVPVLSREGAARVATWETLKPGILVEGRVTGMNKGGLEVDLKGIRAFMPASQVDFDRNLDISVFLGEMVKCVVLEVDRRDENVLLSRRKALAQERAEARDQLLQELAPGQLRHGVVRNVTEYGAFVDLGGVDGLLHVSDMAWSQVGKPADVVSVGQEVDVMILKVDKDGKKPRIALGLKQATPDPWREVAARYPEGTQLKVRVVRLAPFGAFAEVEEGVEALIPISEMSWTHVRRPKDVADVGHIVDTVVIRTDAEKRRMALSMKQASPDPWAGVDETFPQDTIVTGRVTKVTDFGAFVELHPGVEGLVHVSEMSEQRVRSPGDVVKSGDTIQVKVLNLDIEQRRVALSIRAVTAPEAAPFEPAKPAKKRKKPLRGGMGSDSTTFGDFLG